jgi:hypothetical protein
LKPAEPLSPFDDDTTAGFSSVGGDVHHSGPASGAGGPARVGQRLCPGRAEAVPGSGRGCARVGQELSIPTVPISRGRSSGGLLAQIPSLVSPVGPSLLQTSSSSPSTLGDYPPPLALDWGVASISPDVASWHDADFGAVAPPSDVMSETMEPCSLLGAVKPCFNCCRLSSSSGEWCSPPLASRW